MRFDPPVFRLSDDSPTFHTASAVGGLFKLDLPEGRPSSLPKSQPREVGWSLLRSDAHPVRSATPAEFPATGVG